MTKKNQQLIIIGSGPAGLTAGIYAARANLNPLIIEGNKPGGQLIGTTAVENWPGEISILGPTLMMNMRNHAQKTGCSFVSGQITNVDFKVRPFKLIRNDKEEFFCHTVIIASGATPKKLGCPGEDEYWGKGVTTCAVCDGAFFQAKPIVIVGGGDTAMEDASFMARYTDDITIVQIEDKLTASQAMQERVLKNRNVKILYKSTVTKISGDEKGITSIEIKNTETNETQEITVNAVFIAIGLTPNTTPFKGHIDLWDNGYVKIFEHTKTSTEGVFCAGDVADSIYRQAVTSAGTGCMAALDAERYLATLDV